MLTNGEYHGFSHYYVSQDGNQNKYCNLTMPCGSLAIVLRNIGDIEYEKIINQYITIYVDGYYYNQSFNANIDCYGKIHGNISIVFNPNYVNSTKDWAPFINECFKYNNQQTLYQLFGERSSVTFTNLIYENTNAPFIETMSDSIGSINCYQCKFSNLYISSNNSINLITLRHSSTFINCLFENIIIATMNREYSVAVVAVSGLLLSIFSMFLC